MNGQVAVFWFSREVRPGVWVGFTNTDAGNLAFHVGDCASNVHANRAALAQQLAGLAGEREPAGLQFMNQVHGNVVAAVTAGDYEAGMGPTADAMVSAPCGFDPGQPVMERPDLECTDLEQPAQALAVMVADCVPVVFVGENADGPVLGVAHAGRPGVATGVIPATVERLRAAGAHSLAAWIGPSVCGKCYEVPAALRAEVAAVVPAGHATTSWGTPALDLPAAVESQLAECGVPFERIHACTMEEHGLFSHRRSGRDGSAEGRFAGVVYAPGQKQEA